MPSPEMIAHHNLTHVPYKAWCPYCVAGRTPNERSLPIVHADYCLIKDKDDDQSTTACVGRMSPSKALFASVCDVKGPEDTCCVNRLEAFLKDEGLSKIASRSDQEPAIVALIETALRNSGKAGMVTDAAPEFSAVGESASNGNTEKAVQQFEDLLRTLKATLEVRVNARVPADHPLMRWLVQHVASIFNRQSTNKDGQIHMGVAMEGNQMAELRNLVRGSCTTYRRR